MATLKITSPKGTAKFPWLTKADTEFKEAGEYKTGLIVPKAQAKGLIDQIEKQVMACAQEIVDEANKKGKKLDPNKVATKLKRPYAEDEEDDDLIIFKFSQNAVVKDKAVTLRFFDAKGKTIALEDVPAVYGGSVIRISGGARTYAAGANKGVTLDIYAVQIIELSKGSQSSASADDFGFGEEEGFAYESDAQREGFSDDADMQSRGGTPDFGDDYDDDDDF